MIDKSESVLITGASGFVGSHLVEYLSEAGHSIIALQRSASATSRGVGEDRVTRVEGDVRDASTLERVIAEHRPQLVVHAAAITPVAEIERDQPRAVIETNQMSTVSLLAAAAKASVRRFILLSSAGVYAPPTDHSPIREDAPLRNDGGLYTLTKIASEWLCRWAGECYGLDARSVRIGPVYGIHERPTRSRAGMSGAYRAIKLARSGTTIRCNDQHAIYDWIHGDDVARAVEALLHAPRPAHEVYNIAGEAVPMQRLLNAVAGTIAMTRIEWVSTLEEANLPVPMSYRPAPLDVMRLRDETGWAPVYSIESGIAEYVARMAEQDGQTVAGR